MTYAAGLNTICARRLYSRTCRGLGPQGFDIAMGHTLGIYAGSMTSTATLQAASMS